MDRHPRGARGRTAAIRWRPGRLPIGWSPGVLTRLGVLTTSGGFHEYRQLSAAPGTGSPARRVGSLDSACQVDKDGTIVLGGIEVVPGQPDGCSLRRPRIRPWQWADGIKDRLGRFATTARA